MNRGLHTGLAAQRDEVAIGGIVAGWIDDPRYVKLNGPATIITAPTQELGRRYPKITVDRATAPGHIISMVWTGSLFAAIGSTTPVSSTTYFFTTTTDGITWTNVVALPTAHWRKISYNGTNFVVVGSNSSLTAIVGSYSTTSGATWDPTTTIQTTSNQDLSDIVWDGTRFVVVNRLEQQFYYSTTGAIWSFGIFIDGQVNGIASNGSGTVLVSHGSNIRASLARTANVATTDVTDSYGSIPFFQSGIVYHSGVFYLSGLRGYTKTIDGVTVESHTAYASSNAYFENYNSSSFSYPYPTALAHNGTYLLGIYSLDQVNVQRPGCVPSLALLHKYETVRYNFAGQGDIWGRIISSGPTTLVYGGSWKCVTAAVGIVSVDTNYMQVPQYQTTKLPSLSMKVR